MDKIIIKGLKIFAYHGVNPEEKEFGQDFIIDVCLYTSFNKAEKTDDVFDTISYAKAAKLIVKVMTEKKFNLLEAVVNNVAYRLFEAFDSLEEVKILLKKPQAPVKLEFETMAVEIHRKRRDYI